MCLLLTGYFYIINTVVFDGSFIRDNSFRLVVLPSSTYLFTEGAEGFCDFI
jgi:hypothetical protein